MQDTPKAIFTAKLVFSKKTTIKVFSKSKTFNYEQFSISIGAEKNSTILVSISAQAKTLDDFNLVFSYILELVRLSAGYFPDVENRRLEFEGKTTKIDNCMPLKYCSHSTFKKNIYCLFTLDSVDLAQVLYKFAELRQKTNETLDVYHVATSKTDLYIAIKLSLLLQACEGLGKPTMDTIESYPLGKSQKKEIKSHVESILKNSKALQDYCIEHTINLESLLGELKRSISHFHAPTLREVLKNYFKLNEYTSRLLEIGNSLKDSNEKGIDFIQRSLNHRNYFAHLTDNKVKFEGTLANAALEIYSMLFRIWLIEKLSLTEYIDEQYFTNWEVSYLIWLSQNDHL